jgi:hypothetical protein
MICQLAVDALSTTSTTPLQAINASHCEPLRLHDMICPMHLRILWIVQEWEWLPRELQSKRPGKLDLLPPSINIMIGIPSCPAAAAMRFNCTFNLHLVLPLEV